MIVKRLSATLLLHIFVVLTLCFDGSTAFTTSSIAPIRSQVLVSSSLPPNKSCALRPAKVYHVTHDFHADTKEITSSDKRPHPLGVGHLFARLLQQWMTLRAQLNRSVPAIAHGCGGDGRQWKKMRRCLKRNAMALVVSLALLLNSVSGAWAVSGGRVGGTFKSSPSRPSVSRNFSSPRPRHFHHHSPRALPRVIYTTPSLGYSYAAKPTTALVATTMSKTDVLVLGSVAGLVTYGIINSRRGGGANRDTNTGGATSTAVRLALNVPDRYDPDNIIRRMNQIAKRTDTSTRSGVQTLISEVCLELVRQQASFEAAWSDSNHYRTVNAALKDFQGMSVDSRSRYDHETMSNFNADNYNAEAENSQTIADGKATMAVVSIHFVTEGEDVSHFKNMRADVVNMLRWMAATVPVSSLLAGEVLWSPQQAYDTLTKRDIDERYPELTPLI